MKKTWHLLFLIFSILLSGSADAQRGYQTPPKVLQDLVDAPQPPTLSVSPDHERMLLLERAGYPSIAELAQPEMRLARVRINPATNGQSRGSFFNGISLKMLKNNKEIPLTGLPGELQVADVSWSPDGSWIAFTHTVADGIELWVIDTDSGAAKKLAGGVNDVLGRSPFTWMPDSKALLVKLVVTDRGPMPEAGRMPEGPVIQESSGEETTLRTYQDMLSNPHDEDLFEYLTTAQLTRIDLATGTASAFGAPGIIRSFAVSPNGAYVLTGTISRPFSYLVPYDNFPTTYDVLTADGKMVRRIADLPLIEQLPKGFGATQTGPRDIDWRSDVAATLYWVEAQDGGDPAAEVEFRDRLFTLEAPFAGEKQPGIGFELRFSGIDWGTEAVAIAYESWWPKRRAITSVFQPGDPGSKKVLFDLATTDRYNDPGRFLTTDNASGNEVLLFGADDNQLFLSGAGATPRGERPFIRTFDLATGNTEELWRSEAPYYEVPFTVLDAKKGDVILRRESRELPPNYFKYNWKKEKLEAITEFGNPYPALQGIEKQVVKYQRADGLELQGDLYLPKGYDPERDGPLPVIMWAYPREYKSRSNAAQVSGSPYEFVRLSWGSAIPFVTQGYAVLDAASMPIVGEGDAEPNDSFREQLVANAEAAVNKLVEMGVGDRNRMSVGGHSYGAFMTANLLAHSDLFAAGIARSGAYNRTLTPFGFQREERTYWDDPDIYNYMSPFMHADKINEPILLIHGEADNNSGTFPIQSERLYEAINGLGGKARLVMLPHESHGYRGRESILHMLYEMNQWLEKYVKQKQVTP